MFTKLIALLDKWGSFFLKFELSRITPTLHLLICVWVIQMHSHDQQ